MCYVKCQNILVNILVHLLQHLSQVFDLDALAFCHFVIKICFTIKINSICGAGQDSWNLSNKFNLQGPALRVLGFRVAISNSQGPVSRFLGVRAPCSRVPESQGPGSKSPRSQTPRSQGSRSQVSVSDFKLCRRKSKFLGKNSWRNTLALKRKKVYCMV